jgi:Ca2+:H+ antiporter
MHNLLKTIRETKLLWLLVFVPVPLLGHSVFHLAPTTLFLVSIVAIIPLAALLSLATEQVANRTGDSIGGLLNATLGNLTELIIALAALRAGEYMLVKATIAGAIVTNVLFMTGVAFLLGGLRHHVQEFNSGNTRIQMAMLFIAAFGLMVPSAVAAADAQVVPQSLSLMISIILISVYALGLIFTLGTHRKYFAAATGHGHEGHVWPVSLAVGTLLVTTVLVALVSEVFIESLTEASTQLGLTPAFVGFIVVAIVGAAAEMIAAFSAARKNRLDLSVGISFGSSVQIALFVMPVLVLLSYVVGNEPMSLQFWPGAIVMIFIAIFTAALVTASGRSAWYIGVLMLMVYAIFGTTLFILPPGS